MDLGSDSSRESSGIDQTNRINARDYYRNENRMEIQIIRFFSRQFRSSLPLAVSRRFNHATSFYLRQFLRCARVKKKMKRGRERSRSTRVASVVKLLNFD